MSNLPILEPTSSLYSNSTLVFYSDPPCITKLAVAEINFLAFKTDHIEIDILQEIKRKRCVSIILRRNDSFKNIYFSIIEIEMIN